MSKNEKRNNETSPLVHFYRPVNYLERVQRSGAQGVSPAFRRNVQPVQDALDELTEHAYQLCLNMTALDNNFSVQQLAASSFDEDIASIEKNLAAAANANEKKEYEEALK